MIVNTEKLFIENLEIYTSTVKSKSNSGKGKNKKIELYGIQKLRELILQLAMQGKLLQQDKNDESANKLLEKINYERQSLIKSKKIKNYNCSLTNDSWSSIKLPSSWELTTLGIIADWGSGSTPKRENPNYYKGENTWLKSGELNDCQDLKGSSERITEEAINAGSFRENNIGDVLVAMYGATIGKTAILAEKAYTNQAVCGCTPFNGIFNRYLFFYLLSQRKNFNAASEGGAQPNISRVKLLGFPFPLPPIAEQYRIVAKIDELMTLCDQLEGKQEKSLETHETLVSTILSSLVSIQSNAVEFKEGWNTIERNFDTLFITEGSIDQLKQTILQLAVMGRLVRQNAHDEPASEMLKKVADTKAKLVKEKKIKKQKSLPLISKDEEPFSIPKGWVWEKMGNLAIQITDGTHHTPNYVKKGVPFISVKDIDGEDVSFKECKYITEEQHREINTRCNPQIGDILICRIGTLGRVTLVNKEQPFSLFVSVGLIKFIQHLYIPRFAHITLHSPLLLNQYERIKVGGSHTNKLNLRDLPELVLPIPPIAEQHRIIAKVEELMALCDQLKESLCKAKVSQINIVDNLIQKITR